MSDPDPWNNETDRHRLDLLRDELLQLRDQLNDDPKWNLRLILIRKTTDFVALLALVLSVLSLGVQAQEYWEKY